MTHPPGRFRRCTRQAHTYVEVAGLLGIPVGTAKTWIRNALIRLRDLMRVTG